MLTALYQRKGSTYTTVHVCARPPLVRPHTILYICGHCVVGAQEWVSDGRMVGLSVITRSLSC